MQQHQASFWSDIKDFEERLAHDPDSYLFARLSDVYLRVNLVDDALHTARTGVEKHPAYVAGQRALAMASHAKGLYDECRSALERVTAAVPEDVEAQRMLARLLAERGEAETAARALRLVLDFHPQDEECRAELQVLERALFRPEGLAPEDATGAGSAAPVPDFGAATPVEEADVIELTDDDMLVEEQDAVDTEPSRQDPLSTSTLAELYVQQGFVAKALEIYRALHAENPGDARALARIAELEAAQFQTASHSFPPPPLPEETGSCARAEAGGAGDEAIATLEGWLDTIRRIKACR